MSEQEAKPKRSRSSIGKSVNRVSQELLVRFRELRGIAGAPVATMRRWAIDGRSGCYLDAVKRPGKGWMSSIPAVLRFLAEVRLAELADPELAKAGLEMSGESTSPLLDGVTSPLR